MISSNEAPNLGDGKGWLAFRKNPRLVDDKGYSLLTSNTLMTVPYLKHLCKEQKGYQTAYLNDIIYLHFKGFAKIENIEGYYGLKSLWLEGNGISVIENLDALVELRCLYLFLQQNCISVVENLDGLVKLDTLNLCNNLIKTISGLQPLKGLKTLQISHNFLKTSADIAAILDCPSLTVLDLSNNRIEDPEIVHVLSQLHDLAVLNLMSNPVISKIKNYRRTMISQCKRLTYLDDRPVFEKERQQVEAWAIGGMDAERVERARQSDEAARIQDENFNAMMKMQERGREKRIATYGEEVVPEYPPELEKFRDNMLNAIGEDVPLRHSLQVEANVSASVDNNVPIRHSVNTSDILEEVYDEITYTTPVVDTMVGRAPLITEIYDDPVAESPEMPLIENPVADHPAAAKLLIEEINEPVKEAVNIVRKIYQEPEEEIKDGDKDNVFKNVPEDELNEDSLTELPTSITPSIIITLADGTIVPDMEAMTISKSLKEYKSPYDQRQADKKSNRELAYQFEDFEDIDTPLLDQPATLFATEKSILAAGSKIAWANEPVTKQAATTEQKALPTEEGLAKEETLVEINLVETEGAAWN